MSRPRPERILYSSEIPFELHNTGKVDRQRHPDNTADGQVTPRATVI